MLNFIAKVVPVFIYPVGVAGACACIAGIAALRRRKRVAAVLAFLSVAVLWSFSTPLVSYCLLRTLESKFDPSPDLPKVPAIVLLGGCTRPAVAPRTTVEVSGAGDRIIHAARLFKQGLAPVIISTGGKLSFVHDFPGSEARCMASVLENDLGIDSSAIVVETKAENTHDHAPNVAALLAARGAKKEIILVTSAAHMYRAVHVFRKFGYVVHPSPADFEAEAQFQWNLLAFLPCADALFESTSALHEYYGLVEYKILGWI
jgi:uncharacterized SAM-binding protein YcdF (DUF218 family)